MKQNPIAKDELITRAIVSSGWFAQKNGEYYVKQNAFMPNSNRKLSVFRHIGLQDQEIWNASRKVAQLRGCTFYGRADVKVESVINEGLVVEASPAIDNPNHADVINWPEEKENQKDLALQIAQAAKFFIPT